MLAADLIVARIFDTNGDEREIGVAIAIEIDGARSDVLDAREPLTR